MFSISTLNTTINTSRARMIIIGRNRYAQLHHYREVRQIQQTNAEGRSSRRTMENVLKTFWAFCGRCLDFNFAKLTKPPNPVPSRRVLSLAVEVSDHRGRPWPPKSGSGDHRPNPRPRQGVLDPSKECQNGVLARPQHPIPMAKLWCHL